MVLCLRIVPRESAETCASLPFWPFLPPRGLPPHAAAIPSLSPSGNGRLSLMIKDSPYSDAKALLVTFSDVTAHRSGEGGFTKIPFGENGAQTRTCDLKKLVDAQDVLGVGSLSAGHYTQVRSRRVERDALLRRSLDGRPVRDDDSCCPAVATRASRFRPARSG